MEPISFKFEPEILGGHAHVKVWCGPIPDARGLCGTLVMRTHEWYLLRWLLATTPPLSVEPPLDYVPVFARATFQFHREIPIDDTPIVVVPEKWPETVIGRLDEAVASLEASVGERRTPTGMCPHCGEIVPIVNGLTATHDWPKPTRQVCPGSQQNARNPESDGRPLWNGEPNPHYYRNTDETTP